MDVARAFDAQQSQQSARVVVVQSASALHVTSPIVVGSEGRASGAASGATLEAGGAAVAAGGAGAGARGRVAGVAGAPAQAATTIARRAAVSRIVRIGVAEATNRPRL